MKNANGIRSLKDVDQWNTIEWGEMTLSERAAWMTLGWTLRRWNENRAPTSSWKDWNELTASEQLAADQLGYAAPTWNESSD